MVLNSQRIRQLTEALGKRNRLNEKRMIERVLHPHNMQRALKQVIANKGNAGVDRMSVTELTEHVRQSNALFIHQRDGISPTTHSRSRDTQRKW